MQYVKQRKRRTRHSGFSIIESLVGLVLLTLFFLTFVTMWMIGDYQALNAKLQGQANRYLRLYQDIAQFTPYQQLELLQALTSGPDNPLNPPSLLQAIDPDKPAPQYTMKVRYFIWSNGNGEPQHVQLKANYQVNAFNSSGTQLKTFFPSVVVRNPY